VNVSIEFDHGPRDRAEDIICILINLLVLPALLVAVAWLFWILGNGAMGTPGTFLTVASLLVGTAAFSWCTGRGFAGSLIMVGFGVVTLLTAALYGVAGYTVFFG
jgi:hypothetical protein